MTDPNDLPTPTCPVCGLPETTPPDDAFALVCPGCPRPVPYQDKERRPARELTPQERRAMNLPAYVGTNCPHHNVVHVPVDLFLQAREAFDEWKEYLHHIQHAQVTLLAADTALEAIQSARPRAHDALEAAREECAQARGNLRMLQDLAATCRAEAQRLNAQVTAGMFRAADDQNPGPWGGSEVPPAEC